MNTCTLPTTLKAIGDYAFFNCLISDVTIPANVETIGICTWSGNKALTEFVVDPSNIYFSTDNGSLLNINKTRFISYPERKAVTDYIIPDSVTEIDPNAFRYCQFGQLTIPSGVTNLKVDFFEQTSATEYVVDGLNNSYCSVDGVILSKDKSVLIKYPCANANTAYSIPDTVVTIEENAFYNASKITDLVIPESVKTINRSAFYNCSNISAIYLPEGLTELGISAFYNCKNAGELYIGSALQTIPNNAFTGCKAITTIVLPPNIQKVEGYGLRCDNLKEVYVLNSNTVFNDSAYTINSNAEIYGYSGSTAEAYANKYSRAFLELCPGNEGKVHQYSDITSPATCIAEGSIKSVCDYCGDVKDTQILPALGHTEEILASVEPTCENSGLTQGVKCSVCGEILTPQEEVSALGHNYTETVVPATCIEQGYTSYTCINCGVTYISDYIEALGHQAEWIIIKEATDSEEGLKEYTCSICNEVLRSEVISVFPTNNNPLDTTVPTAATTIPTTNIIPSKHDTVSTSSTKPVQDSTFQTSTSQYTTTVPDTISKNLQNSVNTDYNGFCVVSGIGCAKVSWIPDKKLSGYDILISDSKNDRYIKAISINTSADFYVIENLESYGVYYIKLRGYKIVDDKKHFCNDSNIIPFRIM